MQRRKAPATSVDREIHARGIEPDGCNQENRLNAQQNQHLQSMSLHELTGDATYPIRTEGNQVLAHIVNDRGGWGSGFVLALSRRWPQAEKDYRLWAKEGRNRSEIPTPFQLGEVSISEVGKNLSVAHMLAQHGYIGPANPMPLSYDALARCLKRVATIAAAQAASIHMPRIGAGRGGGNWSEIKRIIEREAGHLPVYLYAYR